MNAPEWLCLWYLRLNGYFTIPGFIVHDCPSRKTDVDVLGVRFPLSREANLADDPKLQIPTGKIDLILAEGKRGRAELNGPWTKAGKGAFEYVLERVGLFSNSQIDGLARDLYGQRRAHQDGVSIRIVCFGASNENSVEKQGCHFVSWDSVVEFVRNRFRQHKRFKADHSGWDNFGHVLWHAMRGGCPKAEAFFGTCEKARFNPNCFGPGKFGIF